MIPLTTPYRNEPTKCWPTCFTMWLFFSPHNLKASENILVLSCTVPWFPPPQIPRWCGRLWGPLAPESMPPAGHACPAWRFFGSWPSFLPTMRRQLGPLQSNVPRGRWGEWCIVGLWWKCGIGQDGRGAAWNINICLKWRRVFSDKDEPLGTFEV